MTAPAFKSLLAVRTWAILERAGLTRLEDLRAVPVERLKALPMVTPMVLANLACVPGLEHLDPLRRGPSRSSRRRAR